MSLGLLSFVSPWLLLGLAALPALWWLLRLTPPSPRRQRFPAISLLFELRPREETPYRTPLWLILLRLLLAVLIILGFAEPLLNAGGGIAGLRALGPSRPALVGSGFYLLCICGMNLFGLVWQIHVPRKAEVQPTETEPPLEVAAEAISS